ncbi:hypothetical protein RR48_05824 [Papilio machaon]|uniref:Uncharacterized protein n=1 Tax=Papilio machaon TaxID=76193 RepID=A0A0N1PF79_PAPMA|nr:hypothetical protein RR48_05824 [Papilio machaon]
MMQNRHQQDVETETGRGASRRQNQIATNRNGRNYVKSQTAQQASVGRLRYVTPPSVMCSRRYSRLQYTTTDRQTDRQTVPYSLNSVQSAARPHSCCLMSVSSLLSIEAVAFPLKVYVPEGRRCPTRGALPAPPDPAYRAGRAPGGRREGGKHRPK